LEEASEKEQSPRLDHRVFAAGLIILLLPLGVYLGTASAGGGTIATACTATNGFCVNPNISFVGGVTQNQTLVDAGSLTTPTWTPEPLHNETLMVVASTSGSFAASQVSSVTDLHGDVFTKQIRIALPAGSVEPGSDLELWSTVDSSVISLNSVTVNWNESVNAHLLQVERYQNVASFGVQASQESTSNLNVTMALTITTTVSGSWVFGSATTLSIPVDPVSTPCPGLILNSPLFVLRNDGCSTPGVTDGTETQVADNATTLRNALPILYSPKFAAAQPFALDLEIEMIPIDVEPLQQTIDTSTLCAKTGDTCHVNGASRASGINTNQNLLLNTVYCTGITTSALTTTSTSLVFGESSYAAQSRNVTGAILLVELKLGTSAPSTSFGSGVCTASGTIVILSLGKIFLATSGLTNTAYGLNEYATAIVGSVSRVAATYYGWIEITWQGCSPACAGSTLQFAQWGANQHSSIQIYQVA